MNTNELECAFFKICNYTNSISFNEVNNNITAYLSYFQLSFANVEQYQRKSGNR